MNPDNYGTPEACKKLAGVLARKGIAVEVEFWWVNFPRTGWGIVKKADAKFVDRPDSIPAYSFPEVWRELPDEIIYKTMHCELVFWKTRIGSRTGYWWHEMEIESFLSTNPIDALIELWIWVLQEASHD